MCFIAFILKMANSCSVLYNIHFLAQTSHRCHECFAGTRYRHYIWFWQPSLPKTVSLSISQSFGRKSTQSSDPKLYLKSGILLLQSTVEMGLKIESKTVSIVLSTVSGKPALPKCLPIWLPFLHDLTTVFSFWQLFKIQDAAVKGFLKLNLIENVNEQKIY
jgi:hypothetical protein